MITEAIDCDVHRIEAAEPCSDSYDATGARNSTEQDEDARPGIADPLASIGDYDTILIGSPIWNVRPPMIVATSAQANDVTGTTVHPFVTHAVSGLGRTERDHTHLVRRSPPRRGLRRPRGRGSRPGQFGPRRCRGLAAHHRTAHLVTARPTPIRALTATSWRNRS